MNAGAGAEVVRRTRFLLVDDDKGRGRFNSMFR